MNTMLTDALAPALSMDFQPLIMSQIDTYSNILANEIPAAFSVISQYWYFALISIVFGMILGVIPGMGGMIGLAIVLPLTMDLPSEAAFVVYGSLLGGVSFAGSISAILVNVPGGGGNAATLLDGYPMTRDGRGAEAITASALSSAFGAIIGIIVFILLIPFVIEVALLFGPSELSWAILIGLTVIPLISGEKKMAGMALAGIGLLFGLYGRAVATGEVRYTHGIPALVDGLDLIVVIIGLFAFAEMIRLMAENEGAIAESRGELGSGRLKGAKEFLANKWLFVRCSIIGILVGAVPGAGGTVANFIAYGHAVQSSKDSSSFGQGNIRGVIASESANDAKDGGQLFPTLGLGIPGSGSTAVLLGAFLAHGIIPGPNLLTDHLDLMLIIVLSLLIANIISSTIGLLGVNYLTMVTSVPVQYLFPTIIMVGAFSTYLIRGIFFDVYIALIFGLFGYLLIVFGISRIAVIIALVLGDILETNYHYAIQLNDSHINAFFTGNLNLLLIFVFLAIVISEGYRSVKKRSTISP